MDIVEEVIVKQGKKRPPFMEPTITSRKLAPLLYIQNSRPTMTTAMMMTMLREGGSWRWAVVS